MQKIVGGWKLAVLQLLILSLRRDLLICPSAALAHSKHADFSVTPQFTKAKASLDRLLGFRKVGVPRISRQSAHGGGKVASPTHRSSLPFTSHVITQGHSAAGKSMKNPSDLIGNRTRDLPACSAVPQKLRNQQNRILHTHKESRFHKCY
jgi:hypothetical protein